MFRTLVLNKEIDCNYICKTVQDLINKNNETNGNSPDYIMTIRITKTIDANVPSPEVKLLECNT
jgi:hypothetical protein